MTDTVCPYCNHLAHMEYVEDTARLVNLGSFRGEAAYQCYRCHRMLIGGKDHLGLMTPGEEDYHMRAWSLHEQSAPHEIADRLVGNEEYWEPARAMGKEYPDVDASVAGPAGEAYRCFSINAYRAAVLLARAVIEAAAKSKGIKGRNLEVKIDALAAGGHVRAEIAASAHEVRYIGNDMAHGDFATTEVSEGDALDILDIMDDVLDQVYGVPTRLERRRARRADGREVDGTGASKATEPVSDSGN